MKEYKNYGFETQSVPESKTLVVRHVPGEPRASVEFAIDEDGEDTDSGMDVILSMSQVHQLIHQLQGIEKEVREANKDLRYTDRAFEEWRDKKLMWNDDFVFDRDRDEDGY